MLTHDSISFEELGWVQLQRKIILSCLPQAVFFTKEIPAKIITPDIQDALFSAEEISDEILKGLVIQ
jgi:hypothetical protein